MLRCIRRRSNGELVFLISFLIGISIPLTIFECFSTSNHRQTRNTNTNTPSFIPSNAKSQERNGENIQKKEKNKKIVFLGLLSSNEILDTSVPARFYDWINKIPGEVVFFGRENSTEVVKNIPMVRLKREYDSYTPQKKSFMILKYMYDRHLNDFEFFIRADDDVYIRPDKLKKFLSSINSSETLYIGQRGKSNAVESDKLNLLEDENFCLEGLGVILTRSMLAKVGPYISICFKSKYSTYEYTEVGHCIKKYAGISCTSNNYEEKSITGYETEVISIMKELSILNRSLNISLPVFDETRLGIFFSQLGETTYSDSVRPKSEYAVEPYSCIEKQEYSSLTLNPHFHISSAIINIINQTISTILNEKRTKRKGQEVKPQWSDHIYLKFRSGFGFQQQLQYRFMFNPINNKTLNSTHEGNIFAHIQLGSLQVREYSKVQSNIKKNIVSNDEVVHFLLPLSGRYNIFEKFMKTYEEAILLPNEAVILTIVIYNKSNEGKTYEKNVLNLVKRYQVIHPHAVFKIVQGKGAFARGKALQLAADQLTSKCLLFFIDVDIHFKREILNRIRQLTKQGKQVFYPIVFSEFDPSASGEPPRDEQGHVQITEDNGYFRVDGFGMLSMYKSDLDRIGGFDLSIAGWGMEDIDLFTKIISNSSLMIFRTVEMSLDHVFHQPNCLSTFGKNSSETAQQSQKLMCINTIINSHSSLNTVARKIINNSFILDKFPIKQPGSLKETGKKASQKHSGMSALQTKMKTDIRVPH